MTILSVSRPSFPALYHSIYGGSSRATPYPSLPQPPHERLTAIPTRSTVYRDGRYTMADTITSIRLPDELRRKIERLAQATGRSKSFLMQEAIAQYVENES